MGWHMKSLRQLVVVCAAGALIAHAGGQAISAGAPPQTPPAPIASPPAAQGPAQRAGTAIDRWLSAAATRARAAAMDAHAAAAQASLVASDWFSALDTELTTRLTGEPLAASIFALDTCCLRATGHRRDPFAAEWSPIDDGPLPPRVILLVHGLDEPGGMWQDLAPALVTHGLTPVKFEYPNDQPIASSTDALAAALSVLHARGVRSVDIVAHSMGTLVTRDLLTRPAWYAGDASAIPARALPAITRTILLSPPSGGSILAPLQVISEAREHLTRAVQGSARPGDGLFAAQSDGHGEAAVDLAPGSAFLTDLNVRPAPCNVYTTIILASAIPDELRDSAADIVGRALAAVGAAGADRVSACIRGASADLGDCLVSEGSQSFCAPADVVRVNATHRGVIQRWRVLDAISLSDSAELTAPPPAVPIILDRLLAGTPGER